MTEDNLILAGDIGGTKTNLAIFSREAGLAEPLARATFPSAEYGDLAAMLTRFLADSGLRVQQAAFGVAGPVFDGRAKITKLPWTIDRRSLQDEFGLSRVVIVNDLVATAYGLPGLTAADLFTLNPGRRQTEGPQVIIAPGTGLGETFMLWENGAYRPYPSEGGHTPFAPVNDLQDRLLIYLRRRHAQLNGAAPPMVSNDLLASGRGIPLLYEFLREVEKIEEDDALRLELAACNDKTPVIVRAALAPQASALCVAALELFVAILASEAAAFALKTLATGGVFLGGGMPPRIIPFLQKNFMSAFTRHEVLSEVLAGMPVQVIVEPMTAMLGAARLVW